MRRAAAVIFFLSSAVAYAHPGHGMAEGHWHGFSPEMLLVAALVAGWLLLRSR